MVFLLFLWHQVLPHFLLICFGSLTNLIDWNLFKIVTMGLQENLAILLGIMKIQSQLMIRINLKIILPTWTNFSKKGKYFTCCDYFLDPQCHIHECQIQTTLYDKRDTYNCSVVKFLCKSSTILSKMFFYNHYCRNTSNLCSNFIWGAVY